VSDWKNGDGFITLIAAYYQNDRAGAIFDAFFLSPQMFGAPEIGITYDEARNGRWECHPS
jgi:hypothetical protein